MTHSMPIRDIMTLHVPFRVVKRGGRKEMQMPDVVRPERTPDNTLVKALARAFRWKRMLDSGEFATIAELAERESIAPSYMTRVLRLTLLAPDIIEAILVGRGNSMLTIARLLEPFPSCWEDQAATIRDLLSASPNRADVNSAGPSTLTRPGRYRDCNS